MTDTRMNQDDDQILLLAEDTEENTSVLLTPWNVVIVDDDREVHQATRLALSDIEFMGRPLAFFSAFSAAEARTLLAGMEDIAVILLDVVMETDNAGLELIRYIRQDLGLKTPRIILRTGQPGAAPERSVIVNYDINDYKAKTELTVAKLFATLIAALRGYHDLMTIETSRQGLRNIIDASSSLYKNRSLRLFANGVLTQISAMIGGIKTAGILCTHRPARGEGAFQILAATGRFVGIDDACDCRLDDPVLTRLSYALTHHRHFFDHHCAALYLQTPNEREVVIYLETDHQLSPFDHSMLELFGSNISVGYDNLERYEQLDRLRKMLEADVQQARAVADCCPAPVLVTDCEGVVRYLNPAFTRALGYGEHEVAGRSAAMVLGDCEAGEQSPEDVRQLLTAGGSWSGQVSLRHKSGHLHSMGVDMTPVRDSSGAVSFHVAVYRAAAS